jgi:MinD-like ATPase involved in chromosome partitioning or flagellar assembly
VLIGFTAGKGAPGASLAVVNIGAALAEAKRSVLALDLDPAGGVVSAYLGGEPTTGLWPLVRAGQQGAPDKLREQVQVLHGLPLIAGFPRASDTAGIDIVQIAQAARHLADIVLVDAGRLPGGGDCVLEECERIVLVVSLDAVGILAAEQALVALTQRALGRVSLLVSGSILTWELRQVSDLLGAEVLGGIPWVPHEVRRRRQDQAPLAGKAKKAFGKVAVGLVSSQVPPDPRLQAVHGLVADGT